MSQGGDVVNGNWRVLLVASALALAVIPVGVSRAVSVEDSEVGLVDPVTGEWHLRGPDGFTTSFFYGNPGDFPIMGDWNCDTIDTPGLYRQSDGYVYLRNSNTQGNADIRFYFGNPGDIPIAGDFDGDGCDTVSIYRQTEGRIYIINELGENDGGLGAADYDYYFGNPGDKPFVGDFNGNGTDTVGLHRESTGLVYFRNSNTQGIAEFEFYFGDPGDRLIAGDWNSDGNDSPAVYRPSDTTFYFRYTNTQGNADKEVDFGIPRMIPIAGTFGIGANDVADRDWTVSTIDAPLEWGRFASLGFGADGRAVISHGSSSGWDTFQLALTRCQNLTCTDSDTDLEPWTVRDSTSMAAEGLRLPTWSFHDEAGGRLVSGHCIDASCSAKSYSVIDPSEPPPPGAYSSSGVLSTMTVAADGNPYILYNNTEYDRGLWLAHCNDEACTTADRSALRPQTGFHRFDIAVGIDGFPIMAVFEFRPLGTFQLSTLHCADQACASGTESAIQMWTEGFSGWGFPSVAIGADGLPIIAYNELGISSGSLRVAHCVDIACEAWTTTVVEDVRADFVSMDLGGDGLPFIAYHAAGAVKVAHCDDVACTSSTIATVDPGPGAGAFMSLATDPLGMPMIAYFDSAFHDLKVARLGS